MVKVKLTSGGVEVGVVILGDRRSKAGLDLTERGERSTERREFCEGEGESDSDLATPRLSLLTRGGGVAAGDAFLGVSDTVDLFKYINKKKPYY